MNLKQQMDRIYQDLPLAEIPWNFADPPALLVELIESGTIAPCPAVDLGCGAGAYAVWLATKGFRMTGIDLSSAALGLARERAEEAGVACHFMSADLTGRLAEPVSEFDFAFDWEVLHHVFPADREQFATNVHRLLRPGARYLSVCFSEDDAARLGGEGKYVTTRLGTTLYFSSESEIRALFEPRFEIDEMQTIEVPGKFGAHSAVKALMTRRG